MKKGKLFVLLLVLVMAFSLAGCGSSQTDSQASADVSEETADTSYDAEETQESEADKEDTDLSEEALAAAQELYTNLKAYAGTDSEAFAALYRDTSEDVIQSDYEAEWPSEANSDKQNYVIINSSGNYYAVGVSDYAVSGTYPDSSVTYTNSTLLLSQEEGEWCLDYSDACRTAVNENFNSAVYPNEMVEAAEAGRSTTIFDESNYMYLDSLSTYEGALYKTVKFAWQNEDGSVTIGVWVANGTDEDITIASADYIILTDSELGEIVNISGTINETVKAGYNAMIYLTADADEVSSGTETWSDVQADYSLKLDGQEESTDPPNGSTGTGSTQTCSNCGGTGVVTQTSQYYDAVLGWQTSTYTTACPTCGGTGVVSN